MNSSLRAVEDMILLGRAEIYILKIYQGGNVYYTVCLPVK